jgi:hypothetical protein
MMPVEPVESAAAESAETDVSGDGYIGRDFGHGVDSDTDVADELTYGITPCESDDKFENSDRTVVGILSPPGSPHNAAGSGASTGSSNDHEINGATMQRALTFSKTLTWTEHDPPADAFANYEVHNMTLADSPPTTPVKRRTVAQVKSDQKRTRKEGVRYLTCKDPEKKKEDKKKKNDAETDKKEHNLETSTVPTTSCATATSTPNATHMSWTCSPTYIATIASPTFYSSSMPTRTAPAGGTSMKPPQPPGPSMQSLQLQPGDNINVGVTVNVGDAVVCVHVDVVSVDIRRRKNYGDV